MGPSQFSGVVILTTTLISLNVLSIVVADTAVTTAEPATGGACAAETAKLVESQNVNHDKSLHLVTSLIALGKVKQAEAEFWHLKDPVKDFELVWKLIFEGDSNLMRPKPRQNQVHLISFVLSLNETRAAEKCKLAVFLANPLTKVWNGINKAELILQASRKLNSLNKNIYPNILDLGHYLQQHCPKEKNPLAGVLDVVSKRITQDILRCQFHSVLKYMGENSESFTDTFYKPLLQKSFGGNVSHFECLAKLNNVILEPALAGVVVIGKPMVTPQALYQVAVGWQTLEEELKKAAKSCRNQYIKLAYWVWEDLEKYGDVISLSEKTAEIFAAVKKGIPEDIAKMIWGDRCTIKNTATAEYLIAAETPETEVALQKDAITTENVRGHWKLEPYLGYDHIVIFRLRNLDWKRNTAHLCVPHPGNTAGVSDAVVKAQAKSCYKTTVYSENMTSWELIPVEEKAYQMVTWSAKDWAQKFELASVEAKAGALLHRVKHDKKESHWEMHCE